MTIATPRNETEEYVFGYAYDFDLDNSARILDRAALVLDEYGWIKGQTGSPTVGYCALGAIRKARRDLRDTVTVDVYSTSLADAVTADENIVWFNDYVATRKRDVQRKLRRAARRARALARAKRLQKVGV
jgi:hypothetical protein